MNTRFQIPVEKFHPGDCRGGHSQASKSNESLSESRPLLHPVCGFCVRRHLLRTRYPAVEHRGNARKMKEEPDGCDKSPQRVAPTRVCFFMRQHKSQIIWGESLEQSLREINTWLQHSQHERLRLLNWQHATAGEGAGRCPLESAVSVGRSPDVGCEAKAQDRHP